MRGASIILSEYRGKKTTGKALKKNHRSRVKTEIHPRRPG